MRDKFNKTKISEDKKYIIPINVTTDLSKSNNIIHTQLCTTQQMYDLPCLNYGLNILIASRMRQTQRAIVLLRLLLQELTIHHMKNGWICNIDWMMIDREDWSASREKFCFHFHDKLKWIILTQNPRFCGKQMPLLSSDLYSGPFLVPGLFLCLIDSRSVKRPESLFPIFLVIISWAVKCALGGDEEDGRLLGSDFL